ncbi:hypothetical protein F511_36753 [Dorcoceras hygrometricum]|uniref:Uncharacterized protein n=1 Tax=Dorcoceras hygrometricum TaxID=472368 RepID=A0A2Z7DBX5_9LAMI|nr:hypothetical protein F511_36753 [Dorcoceras hygrometricum]
MQLESHCLLQLKVSCSGGTVASSRGDNLCWKVPVDWFTSRKIPVAEHQSQGTLTLYHLSEMASSLISRSHHIDFDSVFRFDDAEIVQMFESLVTTGLMEFLGCPAIFHESALIEFFANGSVRDGMVVSTIGGIAVEIRESVFAEKFGLPTEGLTDLSEVPRNLLSDASPSPPDYAYALGPPILSPTTQEEKLYFVQSPDSSPAASPLQESSSSSSDASIHFDSEDLPVNDQKAAHTSAPVDSNVFTNALEDLRSYISQRIHESTFEIRSKVNDATFIVLGDLLKQQAWLRQTFQDACDVLERQSKQMNDLKKGLMAPVGTIFQDLFDIKKTQRAQEAKLNALDGQVAALKNEQLEFQNRISADLLSLSTQFADIVEFIRGGDAKKGEGGSSSRPPPVRVEHRPLPTPQSPRDFAGSSSAVRIPTFPRTTGTFAERVEQARRHILESGFAITVEEAIERIRQADFQESDRLQRERERARREKRSSSSRRRRGFRWSRIDGVLLSEIQKGFVALFGFIDR